MSPDPIGERTVSKLSEIRAREKAATKGPWKYCNEDNKEGGCQCGMIGTDENHILTSHDKWGDGPKMIYGENGPEVMRANARFSAHSRTDIPHLLELVERLGKLMDGLVFRLHCDHHGDLEDCHFHKCKEGRTLLKETEQG